LCLSSLIGHVLIPWHNIRFYIYIYKSFEAAGKAKVQFFPVSLL
jgi:hypothetical protein